MADSVTFLKNFLRHPTQVGAIAPSSAGLVEAMVQWFDWDTARSIVEFGPGTGVFTEAILERKHADAKFFAIERSPELANRTRSRCPDAVVYEDSVTNVVDLCRQESIGKVDAIICGLPWASFSDSLQTEIFDAMLDVLAPGGQFATFAYWQGVVLPAGMRFSRRLKNTFPQVQRSHTVWKNLPPAFVYRCVR
ncbi:Ribosomal RNA small subunit methyltransferase A [Rubripirellula lacrimiformis]|uniref:Ribosomal RNA small subunit methyltransferase A n=1 Tax=Rubripirellula lacrimiformis TaxID=1930273 RepID=A0A517N3S9_9BACT|nr:methyltransferase domain-containing protein [Rubripirellula lacrimiformis]QDT01799.1 Ribosomal RNA small subunit methyltransferase A [Rubripirellula lacrimiformis]